MSITSSKDFYREASGYVLTDYFSYDELHDPHFEIRKHACVSFSDWEDDEILNHIDEFAETMYRAYEMGAANNVTLDLDEIDIIDDALDDYISTGTPPSAEQIRIIENVQARFGPLREKFLSEEE